MPSSSLLIVLDIRHPDHRQMGIFRVLKPVVDARLPCYRMAVPVNSYREDLFEVLDNGTYLSLEGQGARKSRIKDE
jgi:hypothetical protein